METREARIAKFENLRIVGYAAIFYEESYNLVLNFFTI